MVWKGAGRWVNVGNRSEPPVNHVNERPSFRIAPVRTPNDLASTVKLFRAYASSLDVDLSYQNFEAEMEAMPGEYAPPAGELLLARYSNGTPAGVVSGSDPSSLMAVAR
jgi:hypothetical protein